MRLWRSRGPKTKPPKQTEARVRELAETAVNALTPDQRTRLADILKNDRERVRERKEWE